MDAAGREMQVRMFVEEVWNGRNYQAVSDLYGDKYVNPFGTGPAARAEPIRRYHDAFPDLHLDIEELIVAGDTVVLRAAFRGTDTGGYAGRAATGRAVDEWVVTIIHFDGDRGRPGVDRCRQARPVHPARGHRQPVAQLDGLSWIGMRRVHAAPGGSKASAARRGADPVPSAGTVFTRRGDEFDAGAGPSAVSAWFSVLCRRPGTAPIRWPGSGPGR
jgi:hypothetical protein